MSTRRNRNMCVRIARDVLEQLRLKRYVATPGSYVIVNTPQGSVDMDTPHDSLVELGVDSDESFKKFFKANKAATCEVCALGSAFVSLVNIENKCSVAEMAAHPDENNMFERLAKYFGNDNVALMESAFECREMDSVEIDVEYRMLEAAADWGQKYSDPTARLRAIMLNVIRNRGDFKLPKKLVAQYSYADSF